MKKSIRLFLAMLLIGSTALTFSSCKDSESASTTPVTPEEIAQSKESDEAQALLSFLSFTSELDSLPDNWFSSSYTEEPTIGTVKDAATPFVRYIAVSSKEEAINKYKSFAANGIADNATSASTTIEGVGSYNFQLLDQSDVFATLDVNIKQQPHLTQIRFVPPGTLGNNATFEGEPYYNFGDVVALKEGGNNISYWICVRPCSNMSEKGRSHWMSFQLNDWDSEKKGVNEKSVNIAKLTSKGKGDYYMPTQLGSQSGSREHLQNLFNLLMILDNPSKFCEIGFPNNLGGILRLEFDYSKVTEISDLWKENKIWEKILPKNVSRDYMRNCFSNDQSVQAFYYGYGSIMGMSVYRANLQYTNGHFQAGEKASEDKLKWKRDNSGLDFREYATKGYISKKPENLKDLLPTKGFIVRYKTGNQLIGKSGNNDKKPAEAFEGLQPIFVYRTAKTTGKKGASLMGDYIQRGEGNYNEVCVLNTTSAAPTNWGENSYYFQYAKAGSKVTMQDREISAAAYMQLLNALMLKSNVYKAYLKDPRVTGKLPTFTSNYQTALNALYQSLTNSVNTDLNATQKSLEDIVDFKALDASGNEVTEDDAQLLETFRISIAYNQQNAEGTYSTADLEYHVKDGKYTIFYTGVTPANKTDFFCLWAHIDSGISEPIDLPSGHTFHKELIENRQSLKAASVEFWNKNKIK